MGRPKIGKAHARKRKSKYSGKALDAELRTSFAGPVGKPDELLYFEEKSAAVGDRKTQARRRREEEERREAELKANPKVSKTDEVLLNRISKSSSSSQKPSAKKQKSSVADLWADDEEDVKIGRKARQAMRGRSTKSSLVPKVRVISDAASYNPELEAYKAGLSKSVDDAIAYEESLNNYTKPAGFEESMERRVNARKLGLSFGQLEASESDDESSSDEEEETKDGEVGSKRERTTKKSKREDGDRVTRRERNRLKRFKENEALRYAKIAKLNLKETFDRLHEVVANVDELEEQEKQRIADKEKLLAEKALEEPAPKINGRVHKYVPRVEAVLPSDLKGTLREMKPHSDLVFERYQSMHQRNMMDIGESSRRLAYVLLILFSVWRWGYLLIMRTLFQISQQPPPVYLVILGYGISSYLVEINI
eukprot:CAMPEP_0171559526 /NCGR_PEP_ID=MMETSP0960-20121227/12884_1 /TAXON_ID=87120 /ORGANISM="Aurantiochytrium limacinum, Strain ATCCMYA-1381" /LENGTH=422 /DNA_ID=CAMNT_0012111013 /DNA_START=160 /DNA_END=1428 /DNA_ORIENTATION=+